MIYVLILIAVVIFILANLKFAIAFFVVMYLVSLIEKHYKNKEEYEKPWFLRKIK